jgi:hypothetical protein
MLQLTRFVALVGCLLVLISGLSGCQSEPESPWLASQVHMKETAPGQTRAAVYLKLENRSAEDRRIQLISTPISNLTPAPRWWLK